MPARAVLTDLSSPMTLLLQESQEVRQAAELQWQELQVELCGLLQKGAELAYLDGALDLSLIHI